MAKTDEEIAAEKAEKEAAEKKAEEDAAEAEKKKKEEDEKKKSKTAEEMLKDLLGGKLKEKEGEKEDEKKMGDAIKALLEEHPELKAHIDRRVTDAVKKRDGEAADAIKEAEEKAKKEAEDAKLLEDGKTGELLRREKEAKEAAETELAQVKGDIKVRDLLDKRGVHDTELRGFYRKAYRDDLKALDAFITQHQEKMEDVVDALVAERLKSGAPPKNRGGGTTITKISQLKDDKARADFIDEFGLEAFKKLEFDIELDKSNK